LRNLLGGLGGKWKGTDEEQLDLAGAILSKDHRTAARVASGPFQNVLESLARRLGIKPNQKADESKLGALARQLDGDSRLLPLGLQRGDLTVDRSNGLWHLRNRAVHDDPDITPIQADRLIGETKRLRKLLDGPFRAKPWW
ncbi:MAG TPA: hypothetical protein VJO15_01045, partial [Dehalococcoidia bacterium]|nr:hypothetical protein [Dehalococcoidia bacterium]